MTISYLVGKFARAVRSHRAVALLCVSLLLGAAILPRVSHGMRPPQDEGPSAPPASGGEVKKASVEFVPGEILVRFRAEALVKGGVAAAAREGGTAASNVTLRVSAGGREILASVERLDAAADEIVEGLRLARVRPEAYTVASHTSDVTTGRAQGFNLRSDRRVHAPRAHARAAG